MNEENLETTNSQTELLEEWSTRITTPAGDAERTVNVDSTTGEPIEGITEEEWDFVEEMLAKIEQNTVPIEYDPSNPSSLTYEQGQAIIEHLATLETGILTVIIVCAVIFIFRWIYKLFAGDFFGGL